MDWSSAWGRSLLGLWDPEGRPAMAPRNSLDTPKDEGTCTQWWIRSEYANMIKYAWTTPDDTSNTLSDSHPRGIISYLPTPPQRELRIPRCVMHLHLCNGKRISFYPSDLFSTLVHETHRKTVCLRMFPDSHETNTIWQFVCFAMATCIYWCPIRSRSPKPPGLVWTRLWKNAYKVAMGSWLRRCKKRNYWGNL